MVGVSTVRTRIDDRVDDLAGTSNVDYHVNHHVNHHVDYNVDNRVDCHDDLTDKADVDVEAALNWHVITTTPGQSVTVAKRLEEYNGFSPLYKTTRLTKKPPYVPVIRPVFPRYTFVRWDRRDPYTWHHINNTRDVTGIMGGLVPLIVYGGQVERLIGSADNDWILKEIDIDLEIDNAMAGLTVEIVEGTLYGSIGVVTAWHSKKGIAAIKIPLLGRLPVINLPLGACKVVDSSTSASLPIAAKTARSNDSFRQGRRPRHLWRKAKVDDQAAELSVS